MKVLKKAQPWSTEQTCTCGALLLVEESDIFKLRAPDGYVRWYYHCPECEQDIRFRGSMPSTIWSRIPFKDDGTNPMHSFGYGRGDD